MPHLLFFYELIGTSFALPLSHSLLTQRGLDVYKNWINEPEYRPAPVDEDFNTFLITILKHMSQFFENEPTTVIEQEDSRNSISVQILFFIRQIYTSYHSSFTPEVKDVLVKVMIGICKKYFQHTNLPELSNDFPAELELALYQLHECWMLTEEMNMELWEIIWRDYSSWTEHVETISQWYGLQQSLTDNVLSHVSNKDKTVEFELQWMPWHSEHVLDKFIMKLSTSFIDYAFIRFSRFLGNCITKSQKIALHATHAIKLLIETFYQYPPSVCDGNVVLKMYGDVLFQTMIINRDKYDDTTSMACETIMRVFVNFMNRTTFNKEWISNLYAGLISILDNPNSVSVTILSYPLLLDLPLPGIEVLLPHYIRYIHEIVFKVNPQQQLRGYIYQLLSKIIPRCTFFKHNPIPVITQPIYKDYLEIIKAIDEILSKQLRDENELQLIVDLFEVSRIQLCETQSLIFTNTVFWSIGTSI
ncbi:Ral GTPase-activating protein subunit alpha/beta N-terminal domain-containing protein [Entamoeba marina]